MIVPTAYEAMMPSAKDVAVAVVTASRETGANPIDVMRGVTPGSTVEKMQATSRARAYAARALDRVFNRVAFGVPRPVIARMVGVSKQSQPAYFPGLESRKLSWWDENAFLRVVNAVMDVPEKEEA